MSRRTLALAVLWASLATGGAEEPAIWSVRVELQVVAVPLARAIRLVPELRRAATFPAAEARVRALVTSGEAELLEQLQGDGLSGTKFTGESLGEYRYRSEVDLAGDWIFSPHYSPYAWAIISRKAIPPQDSKLERVRRRQEREQKSFREMLSRGFPFNPTTPTAIDTRNVGATLEAEPQVDPATRMIDLSVCAQRTSFDGLEFRLAGSAGVPTLDPPQPRFFTCRFLTDLTLASGQGTLLGTHVQQQPRPRMLLFLLHATARPSPSHP